MTSVFRKHVLVCTQQKPDGVPSCAAGGGETLLARFRAEIAALGPRDDVLVSGSGCLGLCDRGPTVLIYPEGRFYTKVQPEEVKDIVEAELVRGTPLKRQVDPDPETVRHEIAAHHAKVQGMMAARKQAGVIPEEIMGMVRAFQPSRVLLTAIELDIFSAVGEGESAENVARHCSTHARGTELLLNALTSMGLLTKHQDRYYNAEIARTFLREGAPHDARAALMHSVNLWNRWSTLSDCIRTGTAVAHEEIAHRGEAWTEAFIAAMHKNAALRAPIVARACDLEGVRRLLDVGGGSGAYSMAFVRATPGLEATVFDLPSVTPLTRQYVEQAGLSDRFQFQNGDLRQDALGRDFDMVFISAICHIFSPEENLELLRKAHAALHDTGRVVIQDFILHDDKSGPRSAALFALNMLVGTKKGNAYSGSEYAQWLREAGFGDIERVNLPGPTDLIVATRKG